MLLSERIRRLCLATIFASIALGAIGATAAAQTCRLQIVHDSPDPSVEWLSLYLNDIKVADSLLFRNATSYLDVPSGIGIQAGLAPAGSTSPDDIFQKVTVNLDDGKDYVAVILGVVNPDYRPNPDGLPIGLTLFVHETHSEASNPETSEYLFINGATDTPASDFRPRKGDPIATGVPFGSAAGYFASNKYVYTLDVAATEAPDRILGSFAVDVGYLKGKAFTMITSGFLNRFENGNGPELKVMVVPAGGQVAVLDPASPSEDIGTMQVINNSPDLDYPDGFDIYFNGGRAINNLRFRHATPFFGIPGNATIALEIRDATGKVSLRSTALTVEPGKNYLVMITGVVNSSLYAPNPGGDPTDLAITLNPNMRLFPSQIGGGEFVFANGVPDAPASDLQITDLPEPITDVPFGEMTGYHTISEYNVLAEMVPSNSDLPAFARHRVSIPFVLGRTFVLYASGFRIPRENRNGAAAELIIVLPDGVTAELRYREVATQGAKLQIIHASADPALAAADLYLDYDLVAHDALFKSATPFLDVPAGKTVTVSVAPPGSQGVEDATAAFKTQYDEGGTYAGVIDGVTNPASFAANPDGRPTVLALHVIDDALDAGPDETKLTILATNEITDAPAANFISENTQLLAQGLKFGQQGSYDVTTPQYKFVDVRRLNEGNRIGASYISFQSLAGRAGILVASGFADPAANGDGPGFSTFLVLDDGSTVSSDQNIVKTENGVPDLPTRLRVLGNYPNPFTDQTRILLDVPEPSEVSLRIMDVAGRTVKRLPRMQIPPGKSRVIEISAKNLPAGMYLYSVTVASASGTREARGRMLLVR